MGEIALGVDETEGWKAHQTDIVHTDSVGRWRTANLETKDVLLAHVRFPQAVQLMEWFGHGEELVSPSISIENLRVFGRFGDSDSFQA